MIVARLIEMHRIRSTVPAHVPPRIYAGHAINHASPVETRLRVIVMRDVAAITILDGTEYRVPDLAGLALAVLGSCG